jgi:hypothetical protein
LIVEDTHTFLVFDTLGNSNGKCYNGIPCVIIRNTNTALHVVAAINTATTLPSTFEAVGRLLAEAGDGSRCAVVSPTAIAAAAAAAVALASSAETIGLLLAKAGDSCCRCLRTSVTKFDDSGLRA